MVHALMEGTGGTENHRCPQQTAFLGVCEGERLGDVDRAPTASATVTKSIRERKSSKLHPPITKANTASSRGKCALVLYQATWTCMTTACLSPWPTPESQKRARMGLLCCVLLIGPLLSAQRGLGICAFRQGSRQILGGLAWPSLDLLGRGCSF